MFRRLLAVQLIRLSTSSAFVIIPRQRQLTTVSGYLTSSSLSSQAMESDSTSGQSSPQVTQGSSSTKPLIPYQVGMNVGELEDWPFDNPKSDYVIHDGTTPKATGRIDHSTPTTRTGIWRCTVGKMECTEQGDELMTILSGKVEVTDVATGQVVLLQPGDSMFTFNGKRLIWNVLEDVTKIFYGSKPDGYS